LSDLKYLELTFNQEEFWVDRRMMGSSATTAQSMMSSTIVVLQDGKARAVTSVKGG